MNDTFMHPMFGGWMFLLWWILIIILVIGVVFFFARQQGSLNREKSALDILKERYVRGEIPREQFEEKKRDIL